MTDQPISDDVFGVLARATWMENRVILPPAQLERKLYLQVNEVLERLGGKWKGGKVKAHVFETDPAPMLAEVLATRLIPPKNPLAFYRTQPEIIARMLDMLPDNLTTLLEPSAGDGAILRALRARFPLARLDAVELHLHRAEQAQAAVPTAPVTFGDFLLYSGSYDGIVMNPPFATDRDALEYVAHIEHALDLLAPGGHLVSIAPAGLIYNSYKRIKALRARLEAWHAHIDNLPRDAFKDSGTTIATLVVHVQKPKGELYAGKPAPHLR